MVLSKVKAPSANLLTREDLLKQIPKYYIDSMFYREYLDREIVIGTVGDRGGGKSAADAVIGLVTFMLAGKPVWSNMAIGCDILIDDEIARKHGFKYGGVVHYQSLPLEKSALLKLDETYRGGCLVIEEINVQYSNVRRFMSNTNVDFNEVCQQLRKFKTSLIYNVIDEMFVDPQLRALTDIFISTYDTAFDIDSISVKKPAGVDFKWTVFPLSGYLAGEQGKYSKTHRPLPPVYFHFKEWRGVYDSGKHQVKGVYTQSTRDRNKALLAGIDIEASPEAVEYNKKWGWLSTIATRLRDEGAEILKGWELAEEIGQPLTPYIKEALKTFGIQYDPYVQAFRLNTYRLERDTLGATQ